MTAGARRGALIGLAIVALVLAAVGGFAAGRRGAPPSDTSAEAGFARDMQTHHAQAVDLSFIIRDKTHDEALRTLAFDIITSQQQQIGQMYGWLASWGLPQTGSQPAMTWMAGASGHQHDARPGGTPSASTTMPGMASPADIARLKSLSGRPADVLFLTLMIAHHKGGVAMAQAVLEHTDRPEVRTLAQSIVTSQTAEIQAMTDLLRERSA